MECEKGEVEMGGGGPVASSPSLLSREDEHEEVRIWSFCSFYG